MAGIDLSDPRVIEQIMRSRRTGPSELDQQYPQVSGMLQGLLGAAPDEIGGGSVLDDEAMKRKAAMRQGALPGFIASTLAQVIPAVGGALKGAGAGPKVAGLLDDYMGSTGMRLNAAPSQTVMRPKRNAFPGIYDNPKDLVAEAASRVAPENPLLKQLFGVSRDDLFDIAQQGTRKGNLTDRPFIASDRGKGAAHAQEVTNPRNTNRILDLIEEAKQKPELYKGMSSWYTMDPLFARFKELYGPEQAVAEYNRFNTLTGMASPGSEVLTELNRGTAANWLSKEGRFDDFKNLAGVAESKRGASFPDDLRGVMGHMYHPTAHAGSMGKYLDSGAIDMQSAKVPTYIQASGVPETGFQTSWPVGDAHWSRLVGLPDVRGQTYAKGVPTVPDAAASVTEMKSLSGWWRDKIAKEAGIEAVPAQAVVWGAGSGATGVTSPIGAGKLELLAQQIGKAAQRMGVSPEQARDMIIRGQAHAGVADPELLGAVAAGTGGGLLAKNWLDE